MRSSSEAVQRASGQGTVDVAISPAQKGHRKGLAAEARRRNRLHLYVVGGTDTVVGGTDTDTCQVQGAPCATLQYALDQVATGDTIGATASRRSRSSGLRDVARQREGTRWIIRRIGQPPVAFTRVSRQLPSRIDSSVGP